MYIYPRELMIVMIFCEYIYERILFSQDVMLRIFHPQIYSQKSTMWCTWRVVYFLCTLLKRQYAKHVYIISELAMK